MGMYLTDALGAIARRWYVVLLGVVLLAATGYLSTRDVPTQYQSSGQVVLLLPPTATGQQTPTNPYLNAPAGLTTLASLISTQAAMLDNQRELAAQGYDAKYSVSVLPGAGPVIAVTAKGPNPDVVVGTRDQVMALLAEDLVRTQKESDFPDNQLIYSRVSGDVGAEVLPGSKKRALIGTAGAAGLATLLSVAGLERLRAAVVRRRQRSTPVGAPPAGEERQGELMGAAAPDAR